MEVSIKYFLNKVDFRTIAMLPTTTRNNDARQRKRLTITRFMTLLLQFCFGFLTCAVSPAPAIAGKRFLPPAPPPMSQSHFFASKHACASSGAFSAQECSEAFARVEGLLRDRAPKFAERYECVVAFRLCDKDGDAYRPASLGVEIVQSAKGLVVLPMLAVETPRDMLREPEAPPGDNERLANNLVPDVRPSPKAAGSPFGALGHDAARQPSDPPQTLRGYRRLVQETQLRLAAFAQNAKRTDNWRAER
jgi:hypothetical protein